MEIVDRVEVQVDYGATLASLLKAAAFDEYHTGRFLPDQFQGWTFRLMAHLVQFRTWIHTPEVLAAMEAKGLRPGNYQELLALAAQYQTQQLFGPIVELGSSYLNNEGLSIVVYLTSDLKQKRLLDWSYFGGGNGWGTQTRFLAFQKQMLGNLVSSSANF